MVENNVKDIIASLDMIEKASKYPTNTYVSEEIARKENPHAELIESLGFEPDSITIERVKKEVCRYCEEGKSLYDVGVNIKIKPGTNRLYIFEKHETNYIEVGFCPVCGRCIC